MKKISIWSIDVQRLLKSRSSKIKGEEMNNTIKHLSIEKSFKINALINVLLEKGME